MDDYIWNVTHSIIELARTELIQEYEELDKLDDPYEG